MLTLPGSWRSVRRRSGDLHYLGPSMRVDESRSEMVQTRGPKWKCYILFRNRRCNSSVHSCSSSSPRLSFVTRLVRIVIRLYCFLVYVLRLAMEGADGSGVRENEHLMENGTIAAEPVTLLTAETSSELEAGEVKENRTGASGEMNNGFPEPMSVSARAGDPAIFHALICFNSAPNVSVDVDSPSVPQSVASPSTISHPQLGIIPSASEVRRILGPLIANNSLARSGTLEKETSSAEPRGDIQNLLTDDICNKFAGQMRVVEEQRGTLPLNGAYIASIYVHGS